MIVEGSKRTLRVFEHENYAVVNGHNSPAMLELAGLDGRES